MSLRGRGREVEGENRVIWRTVTCELVDGRLNDSYTLYLLPSCCFLSCLFL